jgi:hypothetical protein
MDKKTSQHETTITKILDDFDDILIRLEGINHSLPVSIVKMASELKSSLDIVASNLTLSSGKCTTNSGKRLAVTSINNLSYRFAIFMVATGFCFGIISSILTTPMFDNILIDLYYLYFPY